MDTSLDGWDRRSVFYELLRPELVQRYPRQLSSDAFSNWQLHEPRMKTYAACARLRRVCRAAREYSIHGKSATT